LPSAKTRRGQRSTPHSETRARETMAQSAVASTSVRVITYNVLAQVYAKSAWFPWTPRALMKSKARRANLREKLLTLDADLMALQELDGYEPSEENDARWKSWLSEHGYESRYVQRTKTSNAKKDGSCVAWRASTFALEDSRSLEYNDIGYELYGRNDTSDANDEERRRYLRDCVGNLTLLRRIQDGALVVFASTHLYWDPEYADVKLAQAKMLIEACVKFREEAQTRAGGCPVHVIIGGDFNSDPQSDVYAAMNAAFTSASNGQEPPFTNVTPNFTACIDYLFISSSVRVVAVDEQPARDTLGEGLPNAEQPSDHLPVGAEIEFD
jgi:CCR4-NOT transcription complex subunit 6